MKNLEKDIKSKAFKPSTHENRLIMNKKITKLMAEKSSLEIISEKIINSCRYDVVKKLNGTDNYRN